ncbi:hypothetical protein HMPREF7215_2604 [Pyramidobacter piscolens W5455]|uniref:Uncharacterized protein n=1 Tax=Pyramidobacter piscolens W5455 TaxID=352165 RepID=A0ABP2HQX5_9BACT|nr:hypothetical protein HMPREF7215_2604 [Pyramidobacter piscolens W5455]
MYEKFRIWESLFSTGAHGPLEEKMNCFLGQIFLGNKYESRV